MFPIKQLRLDLERQKGKRDQLLSTIQRLRSELRILKFEYKASERACTVIRTVAQQTQEQLQFQLSELPKLAMRGVFDDPYDFEINFEIRRKKTEADFYFLKEGHRLDPTESTGLGAVDIAGTALRISLWSLRRPRTRQSIWLDEPFKHLKGSEANIRALQMLSEICRPQPEKNWPGIQIIMISDERSSIEDIKRAADSVFEVKMKRLESTIIQLK